MGCAISFPRIPRSQDSTGLVARLFGAAALGRAAHQAGGRLAGHEAHQQHIAAGFLNHVAADHLVDTIIGALHQHAGPHAFDQFERRVFLEHNDQIDRFERGQHLGAAFRRVDRPPLALEPRGRSIAVQSDHQAVASRARFRQQLHMAAMQQVEAAIGEADAQTVPPPFLQALVEHRPVEHDLVFRRERSRRQNAMTQFAKRNGRSAALADHHGGGRVGCAHGVFVGRLHRRQHRHHGGHRVAGTGHIAHLDRIGFDVDRRLPFGMQAHALFAARDQHGFALDHLRKLGGGGGDLRLVAERPMHRGRKLLGVWRDHGRAAIDAIVVALRIDDHRLAVPARRLDDGADHPLGQHAFGIVGEYDCADLRHRRFRMRDHRRLALGARRRRCFPIGAHQVGGMMLGDEAHFARRRPRFIDHQFGNDRAELGERLAQR